MAVLKGGFGITGGWFPTVISMEGLNKAKRVNKSLAINKWGGSTYLALKKKQKQELMNHWYANDYKTMQQIHNTTCHP